MGSEATLDVQSLAQRIVEAARLAAAVHLYESLQHKSRHYGRRVTIGGAGPATQGDEAAGQCSCVRRPEGAAVVTDDEPAARPPLSDGRRARHSAAD
jgi:hypothetical protein